MKNYKIKLRALSTLTVVFLVLVSSCKTTTMPVMQLNHNSTGEGDVYRKRGTIKVLKFEDKRPLEEIGDQYITNTFQYMIWTRNTEPLMDEFLKTTIETEIAESGLFKLSNNAEYELSGTIKSIKNRHKTGTVKLVCLGILTGSTLITGLTGTIVIGLIPIGIIAVVIATNKDKLVSVVSYEVILKKDGVKVWQDEINVHVNQKYPNGYKSKKKVIAESAIIIDGTITQAIQKMLKKMNEEVK